MRAVAFFVATCFLLTGCNEQPPNADFDFLKDNLKTKTLDEQLVTLESVRNVSKEHQTFYNNVEVAYKYFLEAQKESDPFKRYMLAYKSRKAYFNPQSDKLAIAYAKGLEPVSKIYDRHLILEEKPEISWLKETPANDWSIYKVIEVIKSNGNILRLDQHLQNANVLTSEQTIQGWLNAIQEKIYVSNAEINHILYQVHEEDRNSLFKVKNNIDNDAERFLASLLPKQAKKMLYQPHAMWQHENQWRTELVQNTCWALEDIVINHEVTKRCKSLEQAHIKYMTMPIYLDNYMSYAASSKKALDSQINRVRSDGVDSRRVGNKVDISPDEKLKGVFLALKNDLMKL